MNPTESTPSYTYYVGGSLEINDPTYVTRQADQDFYESLRAGNFCYVFNSRQMGKSSLRVRTMQRLRSEGFACASIYITSIGSQDITPDKWYAGIMRDLVNRLGLESRINLRNWLRERDILSPVQRFSEFIETVILREIAGRVVIFVDEIDSVLSLDFGIDDFFAVIRECYDRRSSQPEYKRLTFALLGVIAPADLIKDKRRTPFNTLSRAIDLTGFSLQEALPLAVGLRGKAEQPEVVLQEVVNWTGGQPFLTQKVCKLLQSETIRAGEEAAQVAQVIQSQVLINWEAQDVPQHLKTIRDRLLLAKNDQFTGRMLGLCQQILESYPSQPPLKRGGNMDAPQFFREVGGIPADSSPEQIQLRLTGLVVERHGRLMIYNPIYEAVFNTDWVDKALEELRPAFYAVAFQGWLAAEASQKQEFVLRGQLLEEAEAWAKGKRLSDRDEEFLAASRVAERQNLEAANLLLADAERKAKKRIWFGSVVLAIALALAVVAGTFAYNSGLEVNKASKNLKDTKEQGEKSLATADQKVKLAEKKARKIDEEAKKKQKEALDKQRAAELQVLSATQDVATARTVLESVRQQSQATQAEAQAKVNEAEIKRQDAVQKKEQADRDVKKAQEAEKLAKIKTQVGNIKLSIVEARAAFLNGKNFDALLQAMRARQQLESLESKDWANEDIKTRVTLALREAIYGQLRERNSLEGHESYVTSVAFSPDGQTIVSGSIDKTVRLWNLKGELLQTMKGHGFSVTSVAFSPDGQTIASGSSDTTVRLWNLKGKLLHIMERHESYVTSVAFSPDGQTIASGSSDTTVRLWNLKGEELLQTLKGNESSVTSVVFSPDGQTFAAGSSDKTIKLWNLKGELLQAWGDKSSVTSVAFSPDGQTIASGSRDKTIKLWNLKGELLQAWGDESSVTSVVFSPDGQTIASGSGDKTIKLWNLKGELLQTMEGHDDGVSSVAFSPDGQTIASGSGDKTIKLWNLKGELLKTLKGYEFNVSSIALSPDGQTIAAGSRDKIIKLWNLKGELLQTLKGHENNVSSVAFSPDGQTIVSGSWDKTIKLWNLKGELLQAWEDESSVSSVVLSPDGQTIASGSDRSDNTVKIWNLKGELLQILNGHGNYVSSIAFSPNGQTIISGSWDKTIKLWNLKGELLQAWGDESSVSSVAFSPDGKTIVSGSDDKTIKLWNLKGELLQTLKGHESSVTSVVFSPDGQTIASGSNDYTVKLWNLKGELLQTLKGHENYVFSVVFSRDGQTIASGSNDYTVKLWNLNLDDLTTKGCAWLHDYLTTNPKARPEDRQLCRIPPR